MNFTFTCWQCWRCIWTHCIDSLWEFVSSARCKAFHFSFIRFVILSLSSFLCFIQILCTYSGYTKAGANWRQCSVCWTHCGENCLVENWCTEFSVLFPNNMQCIHCKLLIKWEFLCRMHFYGIIVWTRKTAKLQFFIVSYDFTNRTFSVISGYKKSLRAQVRSLLDDFLLQITSFLENSAEIEYIPKNSENPRGSIPIVNFTHLICINFVFCSVRNNKTQLLHDHKKCHLIFFFSAFRYTNSKFLVSKFLRNKFEIYVHFI